MSIKTSFMSFSTPESTLEQMLEIAGRFGYEGIEPRLDSGHAHGIEVSAGAAELRRLRKRVETSPVALACLATSLKFADPGKAVEMQAQARERIRLAAAVGASRLRVFGGAIPEGIEREEAIQCVVGTLAKLAGDASAAGVTLCMETHDHWCDPAHVAEVMRRVDHPAVAVNWDIMHPVRRGLATMRQAYETLRPWIRHVHLHDGVTENDRLRLVPIGEGWIDHREALQCLAEMDYDGFVSGEWIQWEPWERHLPRELAAIKRCMA